MDSTPQATAAENSLKFHHRIPDSSVHLVVSGTEARLSGTKPHAGALAAGLCTLHFQAEKVQFF